MKIAYIEPVSGNKKIAERIFGCSYVNYPFPNIYILIIFAMLRRKHTLRYYQAIAYFPDETAMDKFLSFDKSDIYLIYSVNLTMEEDISFAKRLKRCRSEKILIFMGPGPAFLPEKYLFADKVYVVRGEPDITTTHLIDALHQNEPLDGIEGISFLRGGLKIHNRSRDIIDDLDALPFPARDLIDNKKFYNPKLGLKPFTVMLTSRGCSHRCIFCVPCSLNFARELEYKKFHNFQKPLVKKRSAANVIVEFKQLKNEGFKAVSIIDDQFVWDKERTMEICRGIKDLGLSWGCLSRVDHLDDQLVKLMKLSGCKYIDIGVESFTQEILDYTKKDISNKVLEEGIKLLKANGIFVKLNILFGASPLETKETINYTVKKIKELAPDQVMFDVCSPFPGTEFYEIAKQNNWILGGAYQPVDVSSTSIINYPHLSSAELEKIVRKENFSFFLNWKFILKNVLRLKSPVYIMDAIRAVVNKLFK